MASPIYISVTFCHRKGGKKGVECLQIAFLFGHKCPHFSALCLLVKTAILLEMIEIEIFTFVTVQHIVFDEKMSILPVSELFRPQILNPNLPKMAILD